MFWTEGWYALEIGDEKWMNDVGWPLLFVIALFVASLYIWSYVSRTFDQIRNNEGRFVNRDVANYMEKMVKTIIVLLLIIWAMYVVTLIWEEFREMVWTPLYPYIVDLVLIIFIFLVSMLLVRLLRRMSTYGRRKGIDDIHTTKGAVQVSLLALSYLVYVVAVIISIALIVSLVPGLNVYRSLGEFLTAHGNVILSVLVIILAIYFVTRLVDELLEDYKFKTKKFNPQVIDLTKMVVNYILWTVAILTITFSLFAMFGLAETGFLLIGLILVFISIGLATSYHTLRNIFAGLALMGPALYDLNDRILVAEGVEGDVMQKNLMFTELRLLDGTYANIPNAKMMEGSIYNLTRSGRHAVTVQFQTSFSLPYAEVDKLVSAAIGKLNGLSKEVAPVILAKGLDGNKVTYEVEVFTLDVNDIERTRSELILGLQEMFHNAGLENLI
ncbi:MAG: Small-conductance mechanosensitive channel MscMJ [Methanomassiliicoccales archaeon PtaU1.Bin124]|nr:MAG: Small-conductance mechanosensitive channel MscMJ [Methanomassiliicoccales archaeon PtaU1.Bin124]